MVTGVLLLAAGSARRFGSDKRLALVPGGSELLQATIDSIEQAGLPLLVCLAPGDEALATQLQHRGTAYHYCDNANDGMGNTLADGVSALPGDWEGVLIALGDMPWIAADTYRAIATALRPGEISLPLHKGKRGHPVGFSRYYFPQLAALAGATGARNIIAENPEATQALAVEDPGILRDVNTPGDLHPQG